jgi:tetratricopeptide (TPR) repeat protein
MWALLLSSTPTWAVEPFAATPAEAAMCQARVYSRLGERNENTKHMHHYCSGLRYLDRAYSAMGNKRDMQYKLGVAINNFDYVLTHTRENYAMRGEVHIAKAQALKLAGKKAEALAEFNKALRYDVGGPDAYQALADHYRETGDKAKALEMATEGLRRNPDSKGLQRRYTEYGGQLPYPAPMTPAPVEAQVSKPAVAPSVHAPDTIVPESKPPKIGSPTNPYCRFCPD